MAITRRESLGLFAGALVLPGCGGRRYAAVRVGSKSSGENETIAEIYALALERSKIAVERHMNLGDTRAALGAILRGDIDVYPEYDTVKSAHAGVTRLAAAAMDDSPCLATSQYAAEAYWLLTLATCAKIAPTLRLAATADFLAPNGWLQQLQRAYGGFHFKSVVAVSPGQQYDAVSSGDADVANGSSGDAAIAEKQLIVLGDAKHVWGRRSIAPVVRSAVLRAHPHLPSILNGVSKSITTSDLRQMNMRRSLLSMTPRDVAQSFLDAHRALSLR